MGIQEHALPVQTVFEILEGGMSVEGITETFDVSAEEIKAVLRFASKSLDNPPYLDKDPLRQWR